MNFMRSDVEPLLRQMKLSDEDIKHKRRWLMGLDRPKSGQNKPKEPEFLKETMLPESFLRDDDVFYDTVKTFVERGFGGETCVRKLPLVQSMQLSDIASIQRIVLPLLDDMSNQGLYLLAKVLTCGLMKLEKVRWKLKKIIRESLRVMLKNKESIDIKSIAEQISELCMDPNNFHTGCGTLRTSCVPLRTLASPSYFAAATEVLNALEDFPTQALNAMHRKVRGIHGYMPQLRPKLTGWAKGKLIDQLRKTCGKILLEIGEGDEPPEPFAEAMAVAGLTFKFLLGRSIIQFQQFSPKIEALQNEIAQALKLLEKTKFTRLKNLQPLLDPNCELSKRSFRSALRNHLREYLFECSGMDTIPESLLETLAILNSSSRSLPRKFLSKHEIEEEVECILNVSAQIKQVVWDLLSEHEFDEDYVNAYMENLEETDDSDDDGDGEDEELQENIRCLYFCDQTEGTGETNPADFTSTAPTANGNGSSSAPTANGRLTADDFIHDKGSESGNSYLALQEACDETSLLAYRFTGCLLEEFAKIEGYKLDPEDIAYLRSENSTSKVSKGVEEEEISSEGDVLDSIFFRVLEELIPSFPNSGKEKLKEIMGLK